MRRYRKILLSGLVALLMVGMVSAETGVGDAVLAESPDQANFIGHMVGPVCVNSDAWACIHITFTFTFDFKIPFV